MQAPQDPSRQGHAPVLTQQQLRTLRRPLFPRPRKRPPLPHNIQLQTRPHRPQPQAPPTTKRTLIYLKTTRKTLTQATSQLNITLQTSRQPKTSHAPISKPRSKRVPNLFIPPRQRPHRNNHLPRQIPTLPRHHERRMQVRQALLAPSYTTTVTTSRGLPIHTVARNDPKNPQHRTSTRNNAVTRATSIIQEGPRPRGFHPIPLRRTPRFVVFSCYGAGGGRST